MDEWQLERDLSVLRAPLLKAAGVQVLALYADLVTDAVSKEAPGRDQDVYWMCWQPWVGTDEEHPNRPQILLRALREDAKTIASRSQEQFRAVVEFLLQHGGVFSRVGDLLLADEAAPPDLRRREVLKENVWRSPVPDELGELARLTVRDLQHYDHKILEWIEMGPIAEGIDSHTFKQRRLSWLGDRRSEAGTSEEITEPRGPEEEARSRRSPITAKFVGPTSPVSADELASLDTRSIAEFLKTWRPVEGWAQRTPEGLGRELAKLVSERPELLSSFVEQAGGLHPTYIRSILQGVRDAARAGESIEWADAISTCRSGSHQT